MIRCKNCAALLKDDAKFCPTCGTKVENADPNTANSDTMVCSDCGAVIKAGTKFCPICGASTDKIKEMPIPHSTNTENNTTSTAGSKCPDCGTELKPDAKFCPVCGRKISVQDGGTLDLQKKNDVPSASVKSDKSADSENKCPVCGTSLKPGAKFCPVCGKNLSEKVQDKDVQTAVNTEKSVASDNKCPDCGAALKPDAKFCPVCGKNLSEKVQDKDVQTAVNTQKPVTSDNKCPDCGAALKPDAKFCPVCGKNLSDRSANAVSPTFSSNAPTSTVPYIPTAGSNTDVPAPPVPASPYNQAAQSSVNTVKKPFNFKPLIFVGAAAVVVVIAIIVIVNIINRPPTVNLDDYIEVTYYGADGYGKARVTFDSEKFEKDWKDKLTYKVDPSQTYGISSSLPASSYLFDEIYDNCSLDKDSNLSNGDKINTVWDISDSIKEDLYEVVKCELQYSGKEFTVENLAGLSSVDLFDEGSVIVTFSGTSPNGTANVDISDDNSYDLNYELDQTDMLSNGDEVTLTAYTPDGSDIEDYLASNYYVKPEALQKKYTVTGLAEVVNNVADIPADALSTLKSETEDFIKADTADETFTLKSYEYAGSIILRPKQRDGWSYNSNEVYVVYKVNVTVNGTNNNKPVKTDVSYYTYERFGEIVIVDGQSSFDSDGSNCTNSVNFDNVWAYLHGYSDYNTLFNNVVTRNLMDYTYDTNINENTEGSSKPEESSNAEESSKSEESSEAVSSKPEESSEAESSNAEGSSKPEEISEAISSKPEESSKAEESSKSEESSKTR